MKIIARKSHSTLNLVTLLLVLTVGGSMGCARHQKGDPAPEPRSEDQKTLYTLGLVLGRSVDNFHLNVQELAFVQAGLADAVAGHKTKTDLNAYSARVDELARKRMTEAAEREKVKGRSALAAAEKEAGAVKTPEGFVVRTTREGTGPTPAENDFVKVNYEGRFIDGTVFDSSIKRGEPSSFSLGAVITCWKKGISRLKVGSKATLTCPPDVAYGDVGRPPMVAGGATLAFDIELLEILKAAPAPGMAASPMAPVIRHSDTTAMLHRLIDSRPPQLQTAHPVTH